MQHRAPTAANHPPIPHLHLLFLIHAVVVNVQDLEGEVLPRQAFRQRPHALKPTRVRREQLTRAPQPPERSETERESARRAPTRGFLPHPTALKARLCPAPQPASRSKHTRTASVLLLTRPSVSCVPQTAAGQRCSSLALRPARRCSARPTASSASLFTLLLERTSLRRPVLNFSRLPRCRHPPGPAKPTAMIAASAEGAQRNRLELYGKGGVGSTDAVSAQPQHLQVAVVDERTAERLHGEIRDVVPAQSQRLKSATVICPPNSVVRRGGHGCRCPLKRWPCAYCPAPTPRPRRRRRESRCHPGSA